MAIMISRHSKAKPTKGLTYILKPEKREVWGCLNMDESVGPDGIKLGRQMTDTQRLFGKGTKQDERKYYHYKTSFAPDDRIENGGLLDAALADKWAREYAQSHWPNREVVWAVHAENKARHVHFIVNAVAFDDGRKLHVTQRDWQRMKDDCQSQCKRYGLYELDWRAAVKEKRAADAVERQSEAPVEETFAEQGLKERGKSTWKDELRRIIDKAAAECADMSQFKAALEANGVTLTRCSPTTISYKLGEHRACRGDKLGGDYTAIAIRDALEHNRSKTVHSAPSSLDDLISSAKAKAEGSGHTISQNDRAVYRKLGRVAGIKRVDVDHMCDKAEKASWQDRQQAWKDYKEAKAVYWEEYKILSEHYHREIKLKYKKLRRIKRAEWAIDPRNRRKCLGAMLWALIVLSTNELDVTVKKQIDDLKREQDQLRRSVQNFKQYQKDASETLRDKELSVDAYMTAVAELQFSAEYLVAKSGRIVNEKERVQLQKAIDRRNKSWERKQR